MDGELQLQVRQASGDGEQRDRSVADAVGEMVRTRQADGTLRESEVSLRDLLENLPDVVFVIDKDGTILFVNHSLADIDPDKLINTNGFELIAPEHQPACRAAFDEALVTGRPQVVEVLDLDGQWWTLRGVPMVDEGGLRQVMVIGTDVTERRAACEAVEKEQRLLRQMLDLHEHDRQLIAYDIHDGFVQYLAGALFRLQAFREMSARDPTAAWEAHETATRLVRRAIDEARRLISGLRPPILDEAGIVDAVEYLVCENRQSGGAEIEFVHEVAFDRIAPPLETAIFRIVQELVRNACRHSRSDRVRIELLDRSHAVYLEVRDWGVGFDPSRVAEHRFGLQGVRERVRLLGGQIAIESAPETGTRICVELPLVPPSGQCSTGAAG